jgi:hypothetical protein
MAQTHWRCFPRQRQTFGKYPLAVGSGIRYNGRQEVIHSLRGYPFTVWAWEMPPIEESVLDCVFYLYPSIESAVAGEGVGGTGFLVGVPSEQHKDIAYLYAVTNRHVACEGFPVIRLNTQYGDTEPVPLTVRHWRSHDDGDDIAIAHLGGIDSTRFRFTIIPQRMFLTEASVREQNIRPGDECFMVGRFIGHEGRQRNQPSVRFGNISMMPLEPVRHDDGKDHFVFFVETRSLAGFSGSPVFVYFNPQRQSNILRIGPQPDPWLLGVDVGVMPITEPVFIVDDDGEIVKDEEGKPQSSHLIAQANSGQMAVVPTWKLAELLQYPEFVMARKTSDKAYIKEKTEHVIRPDAQTKKPSGSGVQPFTEGSFVDALKRASRKVSDPESKDPDKTG